MSLRSGRAGSSIFAGACALRAAPDSQPMRPFAWDRFPGQSCLIRHRKALCTSTRRPILRLSLYFPLPFRSHLAFLLEIARLPTPGRSSHPRGSGSQEALPVPVALGCLRVGPKSALNDILFPEIPGRKSRAQRRAERAEELARIELARAAGDNRGWEVRDSGGIGVYQWVAGGKHSPVPERA